MEKLTIGQVVNCQFGGPNDPVKQIKAVMVLGHHTTKSADYPLYLVVELNSNLAGRAVLAQGDVANLATLTCTAAVKFGSEERGAVKDIQSAVCYLFST